MPDAEVVALQHQAGGGEDVPTEPGGVSADDAGGSELGAGGRDAWPGKYLMLSSLSKYLPSNPHNT